MKTTLNVTSKINSLLNGISKNGEYVGLGLVALEKREQIVTEIGRIVQGHIHMPNFDVYGTNLTLEPTFKTGLLAAIAGYIGEQIDVHPFVTKIAKLTSKIGVGLAAGIAIETFVGFSTNNPGEYGRKAVPESVKEAVAQLYY